MLYRLFSALYGPLAPVYELVVHAFHTGKWYAWQRLVWERMVAELGRPSRALEVGCGTGRFMHTLRHQVPSSVGLDLSGRMLKRGTQNRHNAVLGSVFSLPFADGAFDIVVANFFPVRALQERLAWREFRRVLRDGGTCYYLHWVTMAGPLFPPLRRIVYGKRFHDPLGQLATIASAYMEVDEKLVPDEKGNLLHVLVCRKPASVDGPEARSPS